MGFCGLQLLSVIIGGRVEFSAKAVVEEAELGGTRVVFCVVVGCCELGF